MKKEFITGVAIIFTVLAPGMYYPEYAKLTKEIAAVIGYLAFGYNIRIFTDWLYEDSSTKRPSP